MPSKLKKFEGIEVQAAGIEIRNAAGGLNEALSIDPTEWHRGDEITVVLRCKVEKLRFDPIKDSDGVRRVHITRARSATVIDAALVADALDEQARKIEEAKGIRRLPVGDSLSDAHERGEHTELVEGCPECDEEAAAAASGE